MITLSCKEVHSSQTSSSMNLSDRNNYDIAQDIPYVSCMFCNVTIHEDRTHRVYIKDTNNNETVHYFCDYKCEEDFKKYNCFECELCFEWQVDQDVEHTLKPYCLTCRKDGIPGITDTIIETEIEDK